MGLTATGLGPADQALVRTMGPEIIRVLRAASARIRAGDDFSQLWFGDDSAQWIIQLKAKLNRMASVLNLQPIDIHGSALDRRTGAFAAAQMPAGGWRDNTANVGQAGFVTRSQGQGFNIRLDLKWNGASTYRTAATRDSKFQTLVHELTHLIIDTEDEEYGPIKCRALAIASPARAKTNADSWGYFVEEFR